jgi:hypothetical protein
MAEVPAELQEPRRIAGANRAKRRQRRSHLQTSTSSRISCKASINSTSRTAPSIHRSLPSSGRTPRRTVSTRRTSAQSSPTRQRTEDHSSRHTLNIATTVHIRTCTNSTATGAIKGRPTRISIMISTTWSNTTRTV